MGGKGEQVVGSAPKSRRTAGCWEPRRVFVRHTGMQFWSKQRASCRGRGSKQWIPVSLWEEREFLVDVIGLGEVVERPRGGLEAAPGLWRGSVAGLILKSESARALRIDSGSPSSLKKG